MSGLHLQLRRPLEGHWDARSLGGQIAGLTAVEVRGLPLHRVGSVQQSRVDDWFTVQPQQAAITTLTGDLKQLDGLASGWSEGRLEVYGSVGDRFAAQQRGGHIELHGGAGHQVAQQMRGGLLRIDGDVGDDLGGPMPGHRSGMRSGQIVVHGSVGNGAGYRLRRGTLLLLGNVGNDCGGEMVAGTILVGGSVSGGRLGWGMRRGTIVVPHDVQLDPTRFCPGQVSPLEVAKLLAAELQPYDAERSQTLQGRLERFWGDRLVAGQGEIWRIG